MLVLDKENFEREVLQAEGYVLVDFWSPKCEACLELMPWIEEMEEKYRGKLKFCKLDISQARRLAISQKVLGLPTIAFYKDGEKIKQLSGEVKIEDVEAAITEIVGS